MAYEAHKWKIGEEITSEKLNHIEKGIEEAGLPREITDPQDGQTLKYDAASGKWVNGEDGGAAQLIVTVNLDENNEGTLDHTWQEIYNAMPNVALKEIFSSGMLNVRVPSVETEKTDSENLIYGVGGHNSYYIDTPTGYPTDVSGGGPISGGDPIG